ncbi:MAG: hypothetical protein GY710_06120 [Desulfobacteraceae bacterium]|nr:hypothetical protein [Desulfobacteraceae bacterium]
MAEEKGTKYVCIHKCFMDNRRYVPGNFRYFKDKPEKSRIKCWSSVEAAPAINKEEEERLATIQALRSHGLTPAHNMGLAKAKKQLEELNINAAK